MSNSIVSLSLIIWTISLLIPLRGLQSKKAKFHGFYLGSHDSYWIDDGIYHLYSQQSYHFFVLGSDLVGSTFRFTHVNLSAGSNCDNANFPEEFKVNSVGSSDRIGFEAFLRNPNNSSGETYYFCMKYTTESVGFVHQGPEYRLIVYPSSLKIPLWLRIVIFSCLLLLSGLFSGLNLGLMSLTPHELRIISATGNLSEKRHAKLILPMRSLGNVLLCSILLGNTVVNSTMAVLMGDITNGFIAVVVSTVTIVVIGEIIPQSACSRYGLAIASHTRYITWFIVVITCPVSYPLGKLLDFILGHQTPTVYNREQLLEIMKHNSKIGLLEQDEANIISGALKYRTKKVVDVMQPLSECFLLDENAILDFETLSLIVRSGYSRIPIYSKYPYNIIAILLMKDLTFVDPDDLIPLSNIINFYKHPVIRVENETTLDKLLKLFSTGTCHMAIVMYVDYSSGFDPIRKAIGLVTLEDVIEEIIQSEISDETDVQKSPDRINVKESIRQPNIEPLLRLLSRPQSKQMITPNTVLKICQYLISSLHEFRQNLISGTILQRLITHPNCIKRKSVSLADKDSYIVESGTPTSSFLLIIEGHVDVYIGMEKMLVRQGPFSHFCVTALKETERPDLFQYIPDFSIKIIENVLFLEISCVLYNKAIRATKIERASGEHAANNDDPWNTVITEKCQYDTEDQTQMKDLMSENGRENYE